MICVWPTILLILISPTSTSTREKLKKLMPSDWRSIEGLAEEYPYIVALMNQTKQYLCTGVAIHPWTVLTSGNCVQYSPKYIVHGTAVIDKHLNKNTLLAVTHTSLHPDYTYERTGAENVTRLHSNIGLVYSDKPIMDLYVADTYMGNYYASELKDKFLIVVGFGRLSGGNVVVLQKQTYRQAPCANPKWYYCICGFEFVSRAMIQTYEEPFGEGAPVLLGKEIVAVTATPCGVLDLPESTLKYNIFTVIGPYTAWINKDNAEHVEPFNRPVNRARVPDEQNSVNNKGDIYLPLKYIWLLPLFSKFFI